MATTVPMGTITDVTLAAASAVEQLTLPIGANWLVLWRLDVVDVYIVTLAAGTAASNGRQISQQSINGVGYQYNIAGFGFVGLAGSAAGTCRVEVRS